MTTSSPSSSPSTSASANSASKMFLVVAVVLGVLATVLAFAFIQNSAGADHGPKMRIVIAKHDLAANAPLDPERDLALKDIPTAFSSMAALTVDPEGRANYKGQRLNRNIPAGQPVFLADFATHVLELKAPYLALPVQAEPGIAIPGDYVKVLIARPELAGAGRDSTQAPYNASFAANGQAFRVIAIGGSLHKMRDTDATASATSKTVTLEVTEAQAKEIQSALGSGLQRATLAICPPPSGAATNP